MAILIILGILLGCIALFILILIFGFCAVSLDSDSAMECVMLAVVLFIISMCMVWVIPLNTIIDQDTIVYYKPLEIIRSPEFAHVTVTYNYYKDPIKEGFLKDNFDSITSCTHLYQDNNLSRLMLVASDSNILVRISGGYSYYKKWLSRSCTLVCLSDAELADVTITKEL